MLFAKLSHFRHTMSAAQKRAAHILRLATRTLRQRVHVDRNTAVVDITPLAQRTAGTALVLEDTRRQVRCDILLLLLVIEAVKKSGPIVAEEVPEGNGERLESRANETAQRAEDPDGEVPPAGEENEQNAAIPEPETLPGRNEDEAGAANPSTLQQSPVEVVELPGPAHFVVAPPEADLFEMRVWLKAHKQERCGGASKQVIKERQHKLLRLEALRRDTTYLLLLGTSEGADGAERRVARKRAYPTADERKLGLCLCYVKHFKATNPSRLQEIAADFELSFA
uniref:Uncharacterized protein n=1 Tax=Parascaris univalens TaxID=6257 RepID=A0A915A4T9_PARUN